MLAYSVNGGPEKTVSDAEEQGRKTTEGETIIALEDFKLQPGDVVAMHARRKMRDPKRMTDMFFLEAQPFEREYSQSQQMGGGGGGGGEEDDQDSISSVRRKSSPRLSTRFATKGKDKAAERRTPSSCPSAGEAAGPEPVACQRMKSRELAQQNAEFQSFARTWKKPPRRWARPPKS